MAPPSRSATASAGDTGPPHPQEQKVNAERDAAMAAFMASMQAG